MEWLGDLERGFASAIYPNSVLITGIAVAIAVLVVTLAWRGRWDRACPRHPRPAAAALLIGLVLIVPAAWYLGSPLLLSTTIDEPAPTRCSRRPRCRPEHAAGCVVPPTSRPARRSRQRRRRSRSPRSSDQAHSPAPTTSTSRAAGRGCRDRARHVHCAARRLAVATGPTCSSICRRPYPQMALQRVSSNSASPKRTAAIRTTGSRPVRMSNPCDLS